MTRQIARCAHCNLNQFMPLDKKCRRCHKSFIPEKPKPAPAPKPVPSIEQSLDERFACTVRLLRMAREWSQAQFAEQAGVTRQYIYKIEGGQHTPTLKSYARICKGLGVSRRVFATLMCAPCLN